MEDDSNNAKEKLIIESSSPNFSGTMKRYPFNGRSKYLIDKFFIIGYDYATLNKILIKSNLDFIQSSSKTSEEEQSEKTKNKKLPQEFTINEPPSLINELSNDYNKEVLDIDLIIEMIFPNNPKLYYVEEDLNKKNEFESHSTKNMVDLSNEIKRTKTNYRNGNSIANILNSGKNKINTDFTFNTGSNIKNDSKEKDNKEEFIPISYNVIFSSNPQSGSNSKKSINGFAHVFYKKFPEIKLNNNICYSFFIPVVFCIISEFPYYNSYYKLTRQVMLLFKTKIIEVPIEFTIQNIINYTLSPLNDEVILNIAQISLIKLWNDDSAKINPIEEVEEEEIKDINKKKETKEVKPFSIEDNILYEEKESEESKLEKKVNQTPNIIRNKKKELRKSKFNPEKTTTIFERVKSPTSLHKTIKSKNLSNSTRVQNNIRFSCKDKKGLKNQIDFLSKYASNTNQSSISCPSNFTKKEEESEIQFEPIKFQFLPGYPLMQYNLAKVLMDAISPYDVIVIFIYTFLEKDVIFFSNNIELLSLTMNAYQNLNFPLNDEKYYFINACVSYDNYIKGNSTFVGSAFTTMVGINDQYQSKYINSNHKIKDHLAIDLDTGNVNQIKDSNNKETTNKNKLLFDLFKKICRSKEEPDSKNILLREIRALHNDLNKIKETFLNDYKNYKMIDFNKDINKINLQIQESFYRFINNICIYFYQNLTINLSAELKKNVKNNAELQFDSTYSFDSNKYTKEEIYFLDELKDTMKFESFILNPSISMKLVCAVIRLGVI